MTGFSEEYVGPVYPTDSHCERLSFIENHASVAGGAIFARNRHHMDFFGLTFKNHTEDRPDQNLAIASSAKNPMPELMEGNKVGEGGYGRHIATRALGYHVTLHYENGTHILLRQGDAYDLGKRESVVDLPVVEVSMYDHYGQGPARRGSRVARIEPGEWDEVHLPDYLSYARAVLVSDDGLLPNDLVGNLTSGKDNINVGPPLVTPGKYTATLIVPDLNEEHVTLSVNIRSCVINEVPFDDNKGCVVCKPGHYNFHPENQNQICTVCPENADCSGKYVLPKAGYWNAFPCSHHVQRCLRTDACQLDMTKIKDEKVLNNNVTNDEATCNLTNKEIEAYVGAECGKEYRGVLCGACTEDHAKIGQSRCRRCQHWTWITMAIALAVALLAYSSWEQIGGNLKNVKTTWMRRIDRLRTTQRESHVQEALTRAAYSQEDAEIAQGAKEKFVFVLQVDTL